MDGGTRSMKSPVKFLVRFRPLRADLQNTQPPEIPKEKICILLAKKTKPQTKPIQL